jgi:hypothetical protein
MKFRFHRGGYTESMATEVEVQSMQELRDHVVSKFSAVTPTDIRFEHTVFDSRNGWDTWYVIAKFGNNPEDKEVVIGMSDAGSFD